MTERGDDVLTEVRRLRQRLGELKFEMIWGMGPHPVPDELFAEMMNKTLDYVEAKFEHPTPE